MSHHQSHTVVQSRELKDNLFSSEKRSRASVQTTAAKSSEYHELKKISYVAFIYI